MTTDQAQAWSTNLPLPPRPPHSLLSFLQGTLSFTAEYKAFVESHAALEREYASKFAGLVKKFETKTQGRAKVVSVGDEPTQEGEGWERQNTVLTSLTNHLGLLQQIAQQHTKHADALHAQIAEPLSRHEKRQAECRGKMEGWARDCAEADEGARNSVEKAKSKYYSDLSSLASTSAKVSSSQSGTPNHTRADKAHELQRTTTAASRNAYIISLTVKERVEQEIQAQGKVWGIQAQTLHGHLHHELSTQLRHHATIQTSHYTILHSLSERCEQAYNPINLSADQDLWLKYNVATSLPMGPRMMFEPKEGHYELGDLKFVDEPEVVWAKNRWGKAQGRLAEAEKVVAVKNAEIDRLRELVDAYHIERGLGDPDEVLDNLSNTLREASALHWRAEGARAELELIEGLLGEDVEPQHPHDFKSASFTIPTPCDYCGGSVWGLAYKGKTCKRCGASVHSKCEMNVPAECQGKASGGRRSALGLGRSSSSAGVGGFRRSLSISGRSSLEQPALETPSPLQSLAAAAAAPASNPSTPAIDEDESEDEHEAATNVMGTVKYAYDASSEYELSVDVNTIVQVVELDDGSGWIKVRVGDAGREGLVPATYVTLLDQSGPGATAPAATAQATKSTAQYVKALYSYTAADDDEVSIEQGEMYELTELGTLYADGWCEVIVNGSSGVVPRTYVEVS